MTLTDSGPLAAIYLPDDQHHARCVSVLGRLSPPMVTSMACLTEAMHFVDRARGWNGKARLWRLVTDGLLEVHAHTPDDLHRMQALMEKYRDTPMDLADASLLVLGENLNENVVFTIDSHFRAYRLRDGRSFRVVPEG